jgi:hypothetical protein
VATLNEKGHRGLAMALSSTLWLDAQGDVTSRES